MMALFIWLGLLFQVICISGMLDYSKPYEPGEYFRTEIDYPSENELDRNEEDELTPRSRMFVGNPSHSRKISDIPKGTIRPVGAISSFSNKQIRSSSDHSTGNYAFINPSATRNRMPTMGRVSSYPGVSRRVPTKKSPPSSQQTRYYDYSEITPERSVGLIPTPLVTTSSLPSRSTFHPFRHFHTPANIPTTAMKPTSYRRNVPVDIMNGTGQQFPVPYRLQDSKALRSSLHHITKIRPVPGSSVYSEEVPKGLRQLIFSNYNKSGDIPIIKPYIKNSPGSRKSMSMNSIIQNPWESGIVSHPIPMPSKQENYPGVADYREEGEENVSDLEYLLPPLPISGYNLNSADSSELHPTHVRATISNKHNYPIIINYDGPDTEYKFPVPAMENYDAGDRPIYYYRTSDPESDLNRYRSPVSSLPILEKLSGHSSPIPSKADKMNVPTQTGAIHKHMNGAEFGHHYQPGMDYHTQPLLTRNNKAIILAALDYFNLSPPPHNHEQIASSSLDFPLDSDYDEDKVEGAYVYFSHPYKQVKMALPLTKITPSDYSARGQPPVPDEKEVSPSKLEVSAISSSQSSKDTQTSPDKNLNDSSNSSSEGISGSDEIRFPFYWANAAYPPDLNRFLVYPSHKRELSPVSLENIGHSLYNIPTFVGPSPYPIHYNIPNIPLSGFLASPGQRSLGNHVHSIALSGLQPLQNQTSENNLTNSRITQKTSQKLSGVSNFGFDTQQNKPLSTYGGYLGFPLEQNSIYKATPFVNLILSEMSNVIPDIPVGEGFKGMPHIFPGIPFNNVGGFPSYQYPVPPYRFPSALFQDNGLQPKFPMIQPWELPLLQFERNTPLPNLEVHGIIPQLNLPLALANP